MNSLWIDSSSIVNLVIHQQAKEGFQNAEKQIKDYIDKFQSELEALIWQW